jgi:hypothetical protein
MMLGAATAAALLFSSALRGKVIGAITSFAGALMGRAVPGGGIGANLGAILPKVIKYAKILGGSLTAALGATELYQRPVGGDLRQPEHAGGIYLGLHGPGIQDADRGWPYILDL